MRRECQYEAAHSPMVQFRRAPGRPLDRRDEILEWMRFFPNRQQSTGSVWSGGLPPPPPTPTTPTRSAAANEPDGQQQQDCTDGGVCDRSHEARPKVDPELGQHPAADEGANDADDEIADQSKPRALHNLAGQPAGDDADQQDNQQTFTGHMHLRILDGMTRRAPGPAVQRFRCERLVHAEAEWADANADARAAVIAVAIAGLGVIARAIVIAAAHRAIARAGV